MQTELVEEENPHRAEGPQKPNGNEPLDQPNKPAQNCNNPQEVAKNLLPSLRERRDFYAQEKMEPNDFFTVDKTASALSSAVTIGLMKNPLVLDREAPNWTPVRKASERLHNALFEEAILPAEDRLRRRGWKVWNDAIGIPTNQRIGETASRELVSGIGLPDNRLAPLWRRSDTSIIDHAGVKHRFLLSSDEMTNAAHSGLLHSRDANSWKTIVEAREEIRNLHDVEGHVFDIRAKMRDRMSIPISPGGRFSESPLLQPKLMGDYPLPMRRPGIERAANAFNEAVGTYRREMTILEQTALSNRANTRFEIGSLVAGQTANFLMDKAFFDKTPTSPRTLLIDSMTPYVYLSSAHWSLKLGAVVASHTLAKLWDKFDK